ncbi:MAG: hypothetical protein DRI44_07320 [Chlamydiae bacterium]|nr:MAG: hypothetical protein DRI44_07320 [Chlamydiota bacterium]
MKKLFPTLTRKQVADVVDRKTAAPRVPMIHAKDWGEGLIEQYGDELKRFDKYPEDADSIMIKPVNAENMNLSWSWNTETAHDSRIVIDDWAKLDEFIEKLPSPENDPQMEAAVAKSVKSRKNDRYLLFGWWRLFFERPWDLRGMENLMVDYYTEPENVHKLHSALLNHFIKYLDFAAREINPDGFWTSDDLGHQTSLMMSPNIFRKFIKPYYQKIGTFLKKKNIHWWLHSCGNNTEIMSDLIETGVTIFHPVQKGTMNEMKIVKEFGDKLSFLVGFDVQHIIQEADEKGVREEVRYLIDTFNKPEGGMCLAAGNGIIAGTPIENIEAFLNEAVIYSGTKTCPVKGQNMNSQS